MARGPKKHIKRINTPKSWHLNKMGGVYACRPAQGPHKLKESLPLQIILKEKLKYALNGREALQILKEKENLVTIDKKVRRNPKYPVGLMDVLEIAASGEKFRLLYDIKRKFVLVPIKEKEADFKLCKVARKEVGPNKIPYIVTHDGRTIRYANKDIKVSDSIKLDLNENKIVDHYKVETGNSVLVIGGGNRGRTGTIVGTHKFLGSYELVSLKDSRGTNFTTRLSNVFIVGNKKSEITLAKDNGVKLSIIEEQDNRMKRGN